MASTTNECTRTNIPEKTPSTITIWQQNVNKSSTCQHDLISSAALARRGIDFVAIQEPAISNFGTTVASRDCVTLRPGVRLDVRFLGVASIPGSLLLPPATQICGKRVF